MKGSPYKIKDRSDVGYDIFDHHVARLEGVFGEQTEESLTYVPKNRVKLLIKKVDKETQELLKEETMIVQPYADIYYLAEHPEYTSVRQEIFMKEADMVVTIEMTKED